MNNKTNYNEFAQEYAQETQKLEDNVRKHFYALLPTNLDRKLLLDVGCGSGHDAEHYANCGAKVCGIDISDKEIAMTQRKNCGSFVVGDMNDLPYADGVFDIVTSFYALQASNNVSQTLNEIIRVAKSGATILILTKHPFRNLLEGYINDNKLDYYENRNVTSFIFNKSIKLSEPGHTIMEYLHNSILDKVQLDLLEENTDFPASDQVIKGMIYPTYMILRFKKK